MLSSRLNRYLQQKGAVVNRALDRWLPKESVKPALIHEAMRYSVNAGGKRLRPILVIAAAEACGGKAKKVLPTACALELIHTYSLIHDDLPALDNDDLRRGIPTSHKKFGEDIAILAGDALLTHAFYLIAKNGSVSGIAPKAISKVLEIVADRAGTTGMIGGQVADIKADRGRWKTLKDRQFPTPARLLDFIHTNKTSALIRASLLAGATLAGGTPGQLQALDAYGKHMGLAFQITDDVLDCIGDKKKLGKRGSDKANQKLTYPALFGLPKSQKMAKNHINLSKIALKSFGKSADILIDLADFILHRDH